MGWRHTQGRQASLLKKKTHLSIYRIQSQRWELLQYSLPDGPTRDRDVSATFRPRRTVGVDPEIFTPPRGSPPHTPRYIRLTRRKVKTNHTKRKIRATSFSQWKTQKIELRLEAARWGHVNHPPIHYILPSLTSRSINLAKLSLWEPKVALLVHSLHGYRPSIITAENQPQICSSWALVD